MRQEKEINAYKLERDDMIVCTQNPKGYKTKNLLELTSSSRTQDTRSIDKNHLHFYINNKVVETN